MVIRKLLPGGVAIVLLALFTTWLVKQPDNPSVAPQQQVGQKEAIPAIKLQWRVGSRQSYQVTSDSSMQLQMDGSTPAQSLNVRLQARLDMLVIASDDNTAKVGMQLSPVNLEIGGNTDPATNSALSKPFRVTFNTNGYPAQFEFPAEINAKNRSILENLIRMFQLKTDSGTTWTAQESNGSGTYEANYQRISATQLTKSKRNFEALAFAEMFAGAAIDSTESIRFEQSNDWITSMTVNETLTSQAQNGPSLSIKNQATIELQTRSTRTDSGEQWHFIASTQPAESNALTQPESNMTTAQAKARILSAVPELDAATQGRTRLIHELRDLLRADESLPALILEILKSEDLNDRTRADLYLALGLADTESAQQALIKVFQQPDWDIQDALRAVVALGGVNTPASTSVSALWDTLYEVSSGGERQRLASTTTFALGRLGRTLNALDDPEYLNLRSGLLDGALSWADDSQRVNFIHAIGNTGDRTLTNEITSLLNDDLPAVRRATALSLGMLEIDNVANDLVTHFDTESDSQVRAAIAESLTQWSKPTGEANNIISTALQTEQDVNTRYNMARFLSVNLKNFPKNRQILENLLRREENKRIRQMVANALAAES